VARLLAVLLLAVSVCACGGQAAPTTVVDVFLSARDARDVDGAMTVIAAGITMNAPNEVQYRGAGQLRQWLQATLHDYYFERSQTPHLDGGQVAWRDNLYSLSGQRWVGEIAWQASVRGAQITAIDGRVIRGASGVICPLCPPGTRI